MKKKIKKKKVDFDYEKGGAREARSPIDQESRPQYTKWGNLYLPTSQRAYSSTWKYSRASEARRFFFVPQGKTPA